MNNKKWAYLPERIKAKIREVQKFLLELNKILDPTPNAKLCNGMQEGYQLQN
jgi:hypothetical protein